MPIRAEFRHLYRRQWLTVIRPRVLERAHHQCERCRKPLHAWIFTYTWKSRDPRRPMFAVTQHIGDFRAWQQHLAYRTALRPVAPRPKTSA